MKFNLILALSTLLAISIEAQSTKSSKRYAKTFKLIKANEDVSDVVKPLITSWTGSIKELRKSEFKGTGVTKSKDKISIRYYGKVRKNGKTWRRVIVKKDGKIHAAIRVQRKCSKSKKITKSTVKKALDKSLADGKYYKVRCGNKVSPVIKKKAKKD